MEICDVDVFIVTTVSCYAFSLGVYMFARIILVFHDGIRMCFIPTDTDDCGSGAHSM